MYSWEHCIVFVTSADRAPVFIYILSLVECNSGTTHKLPIWS